MISAILAPDTNKRRKMSLAPACACLTPQSNHRGNGIKKTVFPDRSGKGQRKLSSIRHTDVGAMWLADPGPHQMSCNPLSCPCQAAVLQILAWSLSDPDVLWIK